MTIIVYKDNIFVVCDWQAGVSQQHNNYSIIMYIYSIRRWTLYCNVLGDSKYAHKISKILLKQHETPRAQSSVVWLFMMDAVQQNFTYCSLFSNKLLKETCKQRSCSQKTLP